jgi:hypothetical protein
VIGYGGKTGRASGNHLHFETRYADQSFDPERLFDIGGERLRHRDFALLKEYFDINSRATEGITEDSGDVGVDPDAASAPVLAAATATTSSSPSTPSTHRIRNGDNLWTLARRYGTTVARLCELNGITSGATLKIGRVLKLK